MKKEELVRNLVVEWINMDKSKYSRMEHLYNHSKKHRVRTKYLNKLRKVHPKYKIYKILEEEIEICRHKLEEEMSKEFYKQAISICKGEKY